MAHWLSGFLNAQKHQQWHLLSLVKAITMYIENTADDSVARARISSKKKLLLVSLKDIRCLWVSRSKPHHYILMSYQKSFFNLFKLAFFNRYYLVIPPWRSRFRHFLLGDNAVSLSLNCSLVVTLSHEPLVGITRTSADTQCTGMVYCWSGRQSKAMMCSQCWS